MPVVVWAQVGKEFPDMRQNEREIKLIRGGDAIRTADQLKEVLLSAFAFQDSPWFHLLFCPWATTRPVHVSAEQPTASSGRGSILQEQ